MNNVENAVDYLKIAKAIEFLKLNFKQQPSLEDIAKEVHLSAFHFQRMFTEWAGTSPKKFLQYLNVNYAKEVLKKQTLSTTTFEIGLSSTSRLHDLFIKIEGMTPAEYKNGGSNLTIHFSFSNSPFGKILIASTNKGICYLEFISNEDEKLATEDLISKFPNANFINQTNEMQQNALQIFYNDWSKISLIKLHLKGTCFQLKVWEALLKIPTGNLTTYGSIANSINNTKASRAVGTAIGSNPIAFLIPCHRVIQSSGLLGGYMWGTARKQAIIGWEACYINK